MTFWISVGEGVTANAVFVALTVGIGTLALVLRRRVPTINQVATCEMNAVPIAA